MGPGHDAQSVGQCRDEQETPPCFDQRPHTVVVVPVFQLTVDVHLVGQCLLITLPSS